MPDTHRQTAWEDTPLENGLTAGQYADELRGGDPRAPKQTYDQIRDFLQEEGVSLSLEQVRNRFRRMGRTAPHPGQATPVSQFIKDVGWGTVGGTLTEASADDAGNFTVTDGTQSVTLHPDGSVSGTITAGEISAPSPRFTPTPVAPDDTPQPPPTVGTILSGYSADLTAEYDPRHDAKVIKSLVAEERAKLTSGREQRLLRELIKKEALVDQFVDGVKESIDRIAPLPPTRFAAHAPRPLTAPRAIVQILSDMHIGKLTPDFNTDVIKARLDQVIAAVAAAAERERARGAVDELHLLLLGDLCDGANIYPTQHAHSEQHIRNQIWRYGHPYLADAIRTLSDGFRRVRIATVPGNHGRTSKFHHEEDNCDVYLYETLAIATETLPNVDFTVGAHWYHLHPVLGTTFLMVHGHQHISNYGLPFYSLSRKALAWQQTIPSHWDCEVLGHFHSPADIDTSDIRIVLNGSFVSGDEYALEKMGAQSRPSQTLLVVDADEGIIERRLINLR